MDSAPARAGALFYPETDIAEIIAALDRTRVGGRGAPSRARDFAVRDLRCLTPPGGCHQGGSMSPAKGATTQNHSGIRSSDLRFHPTYPSSPGSRATHHQAEREMP